MKLYCKKLLVAAALMPLAACISFGQIDSAKATKTVTVKKATPVTTAKPAATTPVKAPGLTKEQQEKKALLDKRQQTQRNDLDWKLKKEKKELEKKYQFDIKELERQIALEKKELEVEQLVERQKLEREFERGAAASTTAITARKGSKTERDMRTKEAVKKREVSKPVLKKSATKPGKKG